MRLRRRWLPAAMALLVAVGLVPLAPGIVAADSTYDTNCPANLRATPSTSALTYATIQTGTFVTASDTLVPGDSWSASCPGSVSGSTWYAISSVNGTPVTLLYGVPAVYAASGLFRAATFLEGVDVSVYQHSINWGAVAATGKRFAVMRASLGSTYSDPTYPTNHAAARAAGVAVAAYHYATPSTDPNDPIAEANWFVQNAQLQVGDIVPALDLEQAGGLPPASLQAWVQTWLTQVYSQTGVRPMIYTSPSFWQSGMAGTSMFAAEGYNVLWVAHWGTLNPIVPGGYWGGNGWTFWQYDNCGSVSGISGCVDLDRYNGMDLTRVLITSVSTPPPVPDAPPPPTPAPVLSTVAPSTAAAGAGDISLTLQGSNFATGMAALWNGSLLGTTYVSTSQLRASVPAALVATPGTATISVVNPATGASSGSTAFTVTLPPAQVTLTPSATTIIYGQQVTIAVSIAGNGASRPVTLQRMGANETGWTDVASQATDSSGMALFTIAPSVNTQYRGVFAGATDLGAATTAPVRVLVRSTITFRPTYLGKVKSLPYGSKVTFVGTARPAGAGVLPQQISFRFYRYVSGRWTFVTTRNVWSDATGRAAYTFAFTARGQWYVRAVANSTATNANSYLSQVERYSIY